jgi:hypothetical protein
MINDSETLINFSDKLFSDFMKDYYTQKAYEYHLLFIHYLRISMILFLFELIK